MARVGGRNAWIAVPIGLICAAIVAALVWLAIPMGPILVAWAGDTLRAATAPAEVQEPGIAPSERAVQEGDFDCRELYPDVLWSQLTFYGQGLLAQSTATPATDVEALVDALQPEVRVTCAWRLESDQRISSTLALVPDDAALIADAALRGEGFTCTTPAGATADAVVCTRTQGDVIETHAVRGGLWLSSVEDNWHPELYAEQLEAFVWNEPIPQP
ncbi:hypothetical protein [Microbacterium sp. C7(2022)]|uniref:hypothetical protein n=1 Tax=Microbacterium sp. C7(2022) TaxID=2992759 RepID=UPI00237AA955|nr:hypothetical protein [Microbacterium sp. C7(2022)]MDE0545299.1 hypothetical protein [Microbacterium sp. C7(2022)]